MQTPKLKPLVLLALIATLAGCVTTPVTAPGGQLFASDAVMKEMRETRPAFTALAPDEQLTAHVWLLANCAVGADDRRTQFVKLGSRTELALIEAFRMGPPTALLAELADTRRSDYVAIQERLAGEDHELFGPEIREQLAARSEDNYVKEGIDLTLASYRLAALKGLATIGGQTSITWLERTTPTLKDSELSRAAEHALAALRDRKHP